MNKKSQTEIFGLIIIVFMLMIIGLFAAVTLRNGGEDRDIYLSKTIAQNFLTSILEIETSCDQLTFLELSEDCALQPAGLRKQCIGTSGQEDSCAFVKNNLKVTIFPGTLDQWDYGYSFRIIHSDGSETTVDNGETTNTRQRGFYTSNDFKIYLDIYS